MTKKQTPLSAADLVKLAGEGKLKGRFDDLPASSYHQGPGIGSGGLRDILHSPAKYLYNRTHPRTSTPAMTFGSAVHSAILEPEKFPNEWARKPIGTDRRTKAGKEAYEAFEAANQGKTVLDPDTYDSVRAITDRALSHPRFGPMLKSGSTEVSFYAPYDDAGAVIQRARADLYVPSMGLVVDVKTCQDASPDAFARTVVQNGYHVQSAYYLDTIRLAGEVGVHNFAFAAIEKEPPYDMAIYLLKPLTLEAGRILYRRALAVYADCLKTDRWPSFGDDIVELEDTGWHLKQMGLLTNSEEF